MARSGLEKQMPGKIPMRKCVGCGEVKEKKALIRVVRMPDGVICLDTTGRKNGRGAYLCDDPSCLMKAMKRKSLNRAFGAEVPEEIYRQLAVRWEGEDAG